MVEEKVLAACDMQQFQDPKIDDGTALKLAVLLSEEEAASADVCLIAMQATFMMQRLKSKSFQMI